MAELVRAEKMLPDWFPERSELLALPSRRVSLNFHARACILPAPQSQSPKLETTCSLEKVSLNCVLEKFFEKRTHSFV